MKAYVLHGPSDLRRQELPDPVPTGDQVTIRVKRVGICGSDTHYYTHFQIGDFVPKDPFALGHEFAGEVLDVGPDVEALVPGDRVAVEPGISCGVCSFCRTGRYNLCTSMRFYGSASCYPHIHGGFAEIVSAPERNCLRLPAGLDFGCGALLEPLAVGMHGVLRAGSLAGKVGLITGGGTIGQAVLASASALGIERIYVSDVAPFAREFSLKSGASDVLDPTSPDAQSRADDFAPGGFDIVFESSGSPKALAQAYGLVARGGTLVQIGTQPATVTLPANLVMSKELSVYGSFRYAHVFPIVAGFASDGRIDAERLVTHVFPFDQMQQAMDKAVSKEEVIKVQVEYD
jgi:L-idonate 5-dehydrogenase